MSRLALAITVAFACSIFAQQADALNLFRGNKPRPNRRVEYQSSAAPPARTRTNKKFSPFRFGHKRAGTLKAVGDFLGVLTGTAALGWFAVQILTSPESNWLVASFLPVGVAGVLAKDRLVATGYGVVDAFRTAKSTRNAVLKAKRAGKPHLEPKNPGGGFGVNLSQ